MQKMRAKLFDRNSSRLIKAASNLSPRSITQYRRSGPNWSGRRKDRLGNKGRNARVREVVLHLTCLKQYKDNIPFCQVRVKVPRMYLATDCFPFPIFEEANNW